MSQIDLSQKVKFVFYAGGPNGGPKKASEAVMYNADAYRMWLGDIDPGFNPHHNHLDGVDFSREMLIAVGLGEVLLGTTVSVTSIELVTGGIMGGQAFIRYSVHHPAGMRPQVQAMPYVVIKCPIFSGYNVRFLRADD